MAEFILSMFAVVCVLFQSRTDTALEVLALRQQVAVIKRKRPHPALNSLDRLFWTTLRRFWYHWADVLIIVKPETVIGWHCAGFHLYWRWRSRPPDDRPKITEEIRALIRRLAVENPMPPRSTENFKSSASSSPNGPSPDIFGASSAAVTRATGGLLFFRITAR